MNRTAYGFTIIELLVVIVVIAILAAISVVAYTGIQNNAAETALKSDLRNAATQLGLAHVESGNYPPNDSVLARSPGTTYEYSMTNDGQSYCLSAKSDRSGAKDWHIASNSGLAEGVCSGHSPSYSGGGSDFPSRGGFVDITNSYGAGDTIRADIGSVPTGAWMIVVFAFVDNSDVGPPAGWTILGSRHGVGTLQTVIYAKIKAAGDDAHQDFEAAGLSGREYSNAAFVWGQNSASVNQWTVGSFGDRGVNATSTTAVTPTVTTSVANSLVVSIATERTMATEANYTSMTGASPWGWVPQPSANKIQTIAIGYSQQANTGASQAMTVTYPNSQAVNATAIQIAIPPA